MQLRLLGPVEVADAAGGPVDVGGPKERVVLTLLALSANRVVSEDQLVDALWGESPPRTATKTLQAYISRLRRALASAGEGGVAIESQRPGYLLRAPAGVLDLEVVERMRAEARAATGCGDYETAAKTLREAERHWRGRPLGELADEAFAMAEAVRLTELHDALIADRIDAELACGWHAALVGELEALCTAKPLHERLWAQRMLALYRSGRQAEALATYQQLKQTLTDELGLDPSPELQDLEQRVLNQDPLLSIGTDSTAVADQALPTGVVTFLFTDIEGSSHFWEAHAHDMNAALARHNTILCGAIDAHGGVTFADTGDGLGAVFADALAALAAAVDMQQRLSDEDWGQTPLRVRVAVHSGSAEQRDGNFYGPTVNRCARLMAIAHGGQILCSAATAALTRDSLADTIELRDLGNHRLRDLTHPEHVFGVSHSHRPVTFPPLRSLDASRTNLPIQTSDFVGRATDVSRVRDALHKARLVTLTGVGGVGKTRLALQVAADLVSDLRGGVWLVEFANLSDADAVVDTVANALGVQPGTGQPIIKSITDFLAASEVLLILDNCEHLIEAVAYVTEQLLVAASGVRILATSREGLAIHGEHVVAVPPLSLPADESLDAAFNSDAVRLFLARAADARDVFTLDEENAALIARLCRRLEGIPLALELAAARTRSLAPGEILAHLDQRFRVLTGGRRTAAIRQQTLRGALDWSYDLLSAPEQSLLRRLAVFSGGFDFDAAEAVTYDDQVEPDGVADLLGRLVDKSLAVAEVGVATTRYRLLEMIRDYGWEKLVAAGEAETFPRRHAEYYAGFAERLGSALRGPEESLWLDVVERELDNMRAAIAWAMSVGDADLALRPIAALAVFGCAAGAPFGSLAAEVASRPEALGHPLRAVGLASAAWSGLYSDGDVRRSERLFVDALQLTTAEDTDRLAVWVRDRVLAAGFPILTVLGDFARTGRHTADWLVTAQTLDETYELSEAWNAHASHVWIDGVVGGSAGWEEPAAAAAKKAVELARLCGSPSRLAYSIGMEALVLSHVDPDQASGLLEQAREPARISRNLQAQQMVRTALTTIHTARGRFHAACCTAVEGSEVALDQGDIYYAIITIGEASRLFARLHADEVALTISAYLRQSGYFAGSVAGSDPTALKQIMADLAEQEWQRYLDRAGDMTLADLVAMARAHVDDLQPAD